MFSHKWIAVFILSVFGILSACTSQTASVETYIASNPDTYELGQQVYAQHCASCHGADGEGQFPDAPMQPDTTGRIGAPPHDDTGHTWHHADALLYDIVRNGGRGTPDRFYPMPAFSEQLNDAEISAVIFYIKTMWTDEQRQQQIQLSSQ